MPFSSASLRRAVKGVQSMPRGLTDSTQTGLLAPPSRSLRPQFEPRADLALDNVLTGVIRGQFAPTCLWGDEELAALAREDVQRSFLRASSLASLSPARRTVIQAPRLLELLRWAWSEQMIALAAFDYCSDAMRRQQEHRSCLMLSFLMQCDRAIRLQQFHQ